MRSSKLAGATALLLAGAGAAIVFRRPDDAPQPPPSSMPGLVLRETVLPPPDDDRPLPMLLGRIEIPESPGDLPPSRSAHLPLRATEPPLPRQFPSVSLDRPIFAAPADSLPAPAGPIVAGPMTAIPRRGE